MTTQIELTPMELEIIKKHRAKQAEGIARAAFQTLALQKAFEFNSWSETTGYALTFSTFVDQFGFQGPDSQRVYEAVRNILRAVEELV